jgi:type VI secretion system protein VasL
MTALFEMHIQAGGDPRRFREYAALCEELRKLSHPACPDVDWENVERLCLALLRINGADLQTAAFYALARGHLYGLNGLAEGIAIIKALTSEWAALWPTADGARFEILNWLFAQMRYLLRSTSLGQPGLAYLGDELDHLSHTLETRAQARLVTLAALRQQVAQSAQRVMLEQSGTIATAMPVNMSVPTVVAPVVVLHSTAADLSPAVKSGLSKPRFTYWGIAVAAMVVCLGGMWLWQRLLVPENNVMSSLAGIFKPEQTIAESVSLDGFSLFKAGSAELEPDSTAALVGALSEINARPGWLIVIAGHSDVRGDPERNLRLSQARATAVRDWLQKHSKIPSHCFAVQGAGDTQPVADNATSSGRAVNRRVNIRLIPQTDACA